MKVAVVERAPGQASVEHRGELREREIARDAREQRVEAPRRRAGIGEECAHLALPDTHVDAVTSQVRLHQLLDGVVAAPHREHVEAERGAIAFADAVPPGRPPGGIEERVGLLRRGSGNGNEERMVRRKGAGGGGAEAGEGRVDDSLSVEQRVDSAPDTPVVERRPVRVEDER